MLGTGAERVGCIGNGVSVSLVENESIFENGVGVLPGENESILGYASCLSVSAGQSTTNEKALKGVTYNQVTANQGTLIAPTRLANNVFYVLCSLVMIDRDLQRNFASQFSTRHWGIVRSDNFYSLLGRHQVFWRYQAMSEK